MQEAQNSWKELWDMVKFTSSHYRDGPAGHGSVQNQVSCAQGVKVDEGAVLQGEVPLARAENILYEY